MRDTPLKAIRKHCLYCMNGSPLFIRECPDVNCPLYLLRYGRAVKGVQPLKQIRKFCLTCVAGPSEVKNCDPNFLDGERCPLYEYRFGKRPETFKKATGEGEKASRSSEKAPA